MTSSTPVYVAVLAAAVVSKVIANNSLKTAMKGLILVERILFGTPTGPTKMAGLVVCIPGVSPITR